MSYAGGDRDTCLNKKFSLVFWLIQDSGHVRTTQNCGPFLDTIVGSLNAAFKRICVRFERCSTLFIPHYPMDHWEFPTTDQAAVSGYYIDNVINVYVPQFLDKFPLIEEKAYAYSMSVRGAVQNTLSVIVVEGSGHIKPPSFSKNFSAGFPSIVHAFGHFFGLPDTYSENGPPASPPPPSLSTASHEFADASNSAVNGDLFTDTEADCFPTSRETVPYTAPHHCEYRMDSKDGKGQYYSPPVDNFMSGWNCRCRFTQQQYNHMATFILRNRLFLH